MKDILKRAFKAAADSEGGSGPGRSKRKGVNLMDLGKMFPDDAAAERWFEKVLWKNGRQCPHCAHPDTVPVQHRQMPYRCMRCHRYFSVKVGTVMQSSKLGYQKWAMAVYLFATNIKGVSSMKLHRDLGITQKSAWFMGQRLREAWRTAAGPDGMEGPVEIDEAYMGGKEKNRHRSKKGTNPKTAVVGIRDRNTGKVAAKPVPDTTKASLKRAVKQHVAESATKCTDENPSYGGLSNHETVNHSAGEYVRGMVHINGMESFWALLKRGYYGIYHKMSKEHLHRYVNEFAGRHNMRPMDTIAMMGGVTAHMRGKRLTYRALIQDGVRANLLKAVA